MNDREQFIIRAALIYLQANIEDVNEAFETDELPPTLSTIMEISVNGNMGAPIKEEEVEQLMSTLKSGSVKFVF